MADPPRPPSAQRGIDEPAQRLEQAAISAIVRASLAFLEAEPDFARLITIDVYGAGNASIESRERAIDGTLRFVEARLHYSRDGEPNRSRGDPERSMVTPSASRRRLRDATPM